jgi:hypothetical protein
MSLAHVLHVHASANGSVRLGYPHCVTLGEQNALAESGCAGVPDPRRARLQRRSH